MNAVDCNMKQVIGKFITDKNYIDNITGKPLSKSKRIDSMYDIIRNKFYEKTWAKSDRLMACDLIKEIINED